MAEQIKSFFPPGDAAAVAVPDRAGVLVLLEQPLGVERLVLGPRASGQFGPDGVRLPPELRLGQPHAVSGAEAPDPVGHRTESFTAVR